MGLGMNNFGLIVAFGAGAVSLGLALFVFLKDRHSFPKKVKK